MSIPEERINLIVNRIQKVYLAVIVLLFIQLIGIATSEELLTFNPKEAIRVFFSVGIFAAIYLGLRFRSHWVIPLILLSATMLLISFSLQVFVFTPVVDLTSIFIKLISLSFMVFCAYQLTFFAKYEVKKLFNMKGFIIF